MKNYYVGIDLGTSNSSCALFDTTTIHVIRNSQGGNLTPSIVHINAKGLITTGSKAARYLRRDSANIQSGFKRLMGTEQHFDFPAAALEKTPVELSAALITSLLDDVEQQFNFRPDSALITVPALFDIPQSNATKEAALLAGLESVELLQEPVASAFAAGWNEESLEERWLVFDLGGGTFDASLLEYKDGMLRVVAHDGDNFLGGRDFDQLLVDWAIQKINKTYSIELRHDKNEHKDILSQLAIAAEEAKIDLSVQSESSINLFSEQEIEGQPVEFDLTINRQEFESLCSPLLNRAITLCLNLLKSNRMLVEELNQVVLVGGPAMMPILRERVSKELAPVATGSLDPMTLVAQGAALYAASTGVTAKIKEDAPDKIYNSINKFILQHPSMSTDLQPVVLGRLVEKVQPFPVSIRLENQTINWISEKTELKDDIFMMEVELGPRKSNTLLLQAFNKQGERIPVNPETISIVHGLSIADPPLSRSIGVALANGRVREFFKRGTPLPIKRTFTHHSVDIVLPGRSEHGIVVPIVQGEYDEARYCRAIGSLSIPSNQLDDALPAGTPIQITLELDRGGNLAAIAHIPAINKLFNGVLHLLMPGADLKSLRKQAGVLRQRLTELQQQAFANTNSSRISRYTTWQNELERAEHDLTLLQGNNQEAGLRSGHTLTAIEEKLVREEAVIHLEDKISEDTIGLLFNYDWIEDYGTEQEKNMLARAIHALDHAKKQKKLTEYNHQRAVIKKLADNAFDRSPDAWPSYFEYAAARVHEASDLQKAYHLVEKGWQALAESNIPKLKKIVYKIWQLLPPTIVSQSENIGSGIR